ncbi:MAG: PQQ-dependent sugar dehydrogenase, partial [Actinomycetota bacterium]|nr:PQQ-dependent sugar dehydrogenase [Actinomycetota bacterium]
SDGYSPAPGNPLGTPDRPELWLWGLRNPWRFSFDRATGDLWIGDVGQGELEEIDVVAPTPIGRNLGWNRYEGKKRFTGDDLAAHAGPLVEYDHSVGVSVTGGYVYRGSAQPQLDGVYFYGDFGGGWIRTLRQEDGVVSEHAVVLEDVGGIASFGEDSDGEIYVLTLGGPVYRIIAEQ